MLQHRSNIEDSNAGTIAAITAGGLLLIAIIVLLLAMRPATVIRTEPLALPTAVILAPTQAPAAAIQAQPTPAAASDGILMLDRAIVAYATPGGDVLGAIEPGRRYRVISVALGTDGVRWTQLLAEGSGSIWTKDLRAVTTTQAARQAP